MSFDLGLNVIYYQKRSSRFEQVQCRAIYMLYHVLELLETGQITMAEEAIQQIILPMLEKTIES